MRLTHQKNFFSLWFLLAVIFFNSPAASAQEENNQPDLIKLFNQGQDAHEKGDFKTALKFYEEALKIFPEFPEAEFQRGAAFISLGKTDEAEKAFRRAAELRDGWTLPMISLANILIEKNKFAEAESFLTRAVSLDEENASALVALTELRLRAKASPEILKELLARISSKTGTDASLWAARGALENALGDKASAKKSLNRALASEANNAFALSERSEIYAAEGNFSEAIADAQTLVKLAPGSQSAKFRLARFYAASGSSPEALKILEELDSTNADVALLKTSIAAANTEDVSLLEKQLETDAKNARVLERLCNLLRNPNPQKALDYCRRASESEPNNLNHAIGYGAALVQARQFAAAVTLFQKILQIAPDNFAAHANLATALFELKRYAEAVSEYQWLAEKKPDLPAAHFFLAISYDQMGQYTEARTNYQRFLQLADAKQNQLEIDKVNLRLPALEKLIKQKGRKQ